MPYRKKIAVPCFKVFTAHICIRLCDVALRDAVAVSGAPGVIERNSSRHLRDPWGLWIVFYLFTFKRLTCSPEQAGSKNKRKWQLF